MNLTIKAYFNSLIIKASYYLANSLRYKPTKYYKSEKFFSTHKNKSFSN